jgi:hypothetical protein
VRSVAILGLVGLSSCGFELLGGRCVDGWTERDGQCVAASDGGAGGEAPPGGAPSGGAGGAETGGAPTGGGPESGGGGQAGGEPGGGGGAGGAGGEGGGLVCDPLTACGGVCVDLQTDPAHCGFCNHPCQTGLCSDGQCQGAFAGHVVMMGVDLSVTSPAGSPAKLLGNAAFLHPADPLEVVVYEEFGDDPAVATALAILTLEAAIRGRTLVTNAVSDPQQLASLAATLQASVVILPAMPSGADAELTAAAQLLATPLSDFASQGGVVIGLTRELHAAAFMREVGLFGDLTAHPATPGPLVIAAWLDAISTGVLSPFAQGPQSLAFESPVFAGPDASIVVRSSGDEPVVVHRVFSP